MKIRKLAFSVAATCVAIAAAAPVMGKSYPSKPIEMIVSFPAGGMTDTVSRVLADEMSKTLGQTIVIINRGGAGGIIGVGAIARSPNDGYTIGSIADAALTTLPNIQEVPYNLESFDYLCRTFSVPVLMVVNPSSRFDSLQELIVYAKEHPDKLNFATVGPGSLPHLAALDFLKKAGVSMGHVPYKGEGQAVIDLLGDRVDVYFGTSAAASKHNLKQLAIANNTRTTEAPDTPTFTELGYDVVWSIMGGLIAPKGINPAAAAAVENACVEGMKTPRYLSVLKTMQAGPEHLSSDDFKKTIVAANAKSKVLLKDVNLQP